jgi:hypothetical protein
VKFLVDNALSPVLRRRYGTRKPSDHAGRFDPATKRRLKVAQPKLD